MYTCRYKDYHSIKSLHYKLRHVHISECVHKAFPKHETKGWTGICTWAYFYKTTIIVHIVRIRVEFHIPLFWHTLSTVYLLNAFRQILPDVRQIDRFHTMRIVCTSPMSAATTHSFFSLFLQT